MHSHNLCSLKEGEMNLFFFSIFVLQVFVVFQTWTSVPVLTSTTPCWSPVCWWPSFWAPSCPASWCHVTAAAAQLTGRGGWGKTRRRRCPTPSPCGPWPSSTDFWTDSPRWVTTWLILHYADTYFKYSRFGTCFLFIYIIYNIFIHTFILLHWILSEIKDDRFDASVNTNSIYVSDSHTWFRHTTCWLFHVIAEWERQQLQKSSFSGKHMQICVQPSYVVVESTDGFLKSSGWCGGGWTSPSLRESGKQTHNLCHVSHTFAADLAGFIVQERAKKQQHNQLNFEQHC